MSDKLSRNELAQKYYGEDFDDLCSSNKETIEEILKERKEKNRKREAVFIE